MTGRPGVVGALLLALLPGCNKRLVLVDRDHDEEPPSRAVATAQASAPALAPAGDTTAAASGSVARADAPAPSKPAAAAPAGNAYAATCAGTCEKTLRCMGAYNATEQAACVTSCEAGTPDPARFARVNKMDCATLLATLKGGNKGGGGGASSGGAAEPCGKNQCSTCVFDGTSCYSRVPPFLACDACCCRPGGPAPRWE
jgi:hypothetical protein